MRMWLISPKLMCKKHLLGEHVELHMLKGCLEKGRSIGNFILKGFVAVYKIYLRHEELVEEMIKRGFSHNSPIFPILKSKEYFLPLDLINAESNLKELSRRCPECRKRIKEAKCLKKQKLLK